MAIPSHRSPSLIAASTKRPKGCSAASAASRTPISSIPALPKTKSLLATPESRNASQRAASRPYLSRNRRSVAAKLGTILTTWSSQIMGSPGFPTRQSGARRPPSNLNVRIIPRTRSPRSRPSPAGDACRERRRIGGSTRRRPSRSAGCSGSYAAPRGPDRGVVAAAPHRPAARAPPSGARSVPSRRPPSRQSASANHRRRAHPRQAPRWGHDIRAAAGPPQPVAPPKCAR